MNTKQLKAEFYKKFTRRSDFEPRLPVISHSDDCDIIWNWFEAKLAEQEKKHQQEMSHTVPVDMIAKLEGKHQQEMLEAKEQAIDEMGMETAIRWWLKHYKGIEHFAEGGKVKPEVMYTISTILERCFKQFGLSVEAPEKVDSTEAK